MASKTIVLSAALALLTFTAQAAKPASYISLPISGSWHAPARATAAAHNPPSACPAPSQGISPRSEAAYSLPSVYNPSAYTLPSYYNPAAPNPTSSPKKSKKTHTCTKTTAHVHVNPHIHPFPSNPPLPAYSHSRRNDYGHGKAHHRAQNGAQHPDDYVAQHEQQHPHAQAHHSVKPAQHPKPKHTHISSTTTRYITSTVPYNPLVGLTHYPVIKRSVDVDADGEVERPGPEDGGQYEARLASLMPEDASSSIDDFEEQYLARRDKLMREHKSESGADAREKVVDFGDDAPSAAKFADFEGSTAAEEETGQSVEKRSFLGDLLDKMRRFRSKRTGEGFVRTAEADAKEGGAKHHAKRDVEGTAETGAEWDESEYHLEEPSGDDEDDWLSFDEDTDSEDDEESLARRSTEDDWVYSYADLLDEDGLWEELSKRGLDADDSGVGEAALENDYPAAAELELSAFGGGQENASFVRRWIHSFYE